MRYINVDTVSYLHTNGKTYPVKTIREIPSEVTKFTINIIGNEYLDEIASRKDVYGQNGEMQTYRLFDANIVKLKEANFNMSKIKKIKVPI